MVDATIISAPPSTKNEAHARDPEMHQTKKGNEWSFGMKADIGADADSGLVHSLHTTAANESDVAHAHALLHGQEKHVFADAGYTGLARRDEIVKATAYALRHSTITDLIALHRLDTLTVAQLSGTSLAMIEKHYGHLLRDHAAKALASLTL